MTLSVWSAGRSGPCVLAGGRVLTVTLPKSEETKPKRVQVKVK